MPQSVRGAQIGDAISIGHNFASVIILGLYELLFFHKRELLNGKNFYNKMVVRKQS